MTHEPNWERRARSMNYTIHPIPFFTLANQFQLRTNPLNARATTFDQCWNSTIFFYNVHQKLNGIHDNGIVQGFPTWGSGPPVGSRDLKKGVAEANLRRQKMIFSIWEGEIIIKYQEIRSHHLKMIIMIVVKIFAWGSPLSRHWRRWSKRLGNPGIVE